MFSYHDYKIVHVFFVILMLTSFSAQLFASEKKKFLSIFSGLATLMVLVGGMGLMARLGIGHGESWPLWIKLKMGLWLILSIGLPVVIKRMKRFASMGYTVMIILTLLAVYSAVTKPF